MDSQSTHDFKFKVALYGSEGGEDWKNNCHPPHDPRGRAKGGPAES